MKLQSSLGRISQNYRPDMNMSGYLTAARVTKVHHKSGTADVVVINTKDTFSSNAENEGRFAARILQGFSNFDEQRGKSWGSISPIGVGSLVLLGFMDNMKSRPVILGSLPNPDNVENVLPEVYPLKEKTPGFQRREALKTLQVFPSLAYKKMDGEGNMEFAHTSKSFFAMYNLSMDTQSYLNDNHNGFDHQHLSENDSTTGKVYETDFDEAKEPANMLFVHRTSFKDEETTWTKFFLSAAGIFRMTRDNNDDKLTFMELNELGRFRVKRQVDNAYHDDSENYGEIDVGTDGSVKLRRVMGEEIAEVGVDEVGNVDLYHSSGSSFKMGEDLEFEVQGDIRSESLSRFIETNHIVVSETEPENPKPFLIWIDPRE